MAGPAESAFDGRIRQPGTVSTWARRPTARLARGRTYRHCRAHVPVRGISSSSINQQNKALRVCLVF